MEKMKISLPIIVEGRYDKSTLLSFLDATVITTGGFSIFNNKEKTALIKRLATEGIIVLTDSDGGGRQIRSFLSQIIPKDKIYHLYTPEIHGKEKRKRSPSAAGMLGVEGMSRETICDLLKPFAVGEKIQKSEKMITKVDFYEQKLTGFENSKARREALARAANLPHDMSANALIEALNLLVGYDGFIKLLSEIE